MVNYHALQWVRDGTGTRPTRERLAHLRRAGWVERLPSGRHRLTHKGDDALNVFNRQVAHRLAQIGRAA
jgi:Mn-dependent DtxR family transcriptional regulator